MVESMNHLLQPQAWVSKSSSITVDGAKSSIIHSNHQPLTPCTQLDEPFPTEGKNRPMKSSHRTCSSQQINDCNIGTVTQQQMISKSRLATTRTLNSIDLNGGQGLVEALLSTILAYYLLRRWHHLNGSIGLVLVAVVDGTSMKGQQQCCKGRIIFRDLHPTSSLTGRKLQTSTHIRSTIKETRSIDLQHSKKWKLTFPVLQRSSKATKARSSIHANYDRELFRS